MGQYVVSCGAHASIAYFGAGKNHRQGLTRDQAAQETVVLSGEAVRVV